MSKSKFIDDKGHCTVAGIVEIQSRVKVTTEAEKENGLSTKVRATRATARKEVAKQFGISTDAVCRIARDGKAMITRRKKLQLA